MPVITRSRVRVLAATLTVMVLLTVTLGVVLPGCGTPPAYPPDLTFPTRDDRLVLRVPTTQPAGVGEPGKLDAELAAALMSINAAKGVEIGAGFAAAALRGEDNADQMRAGPDGRPAFLSNQAGGILGGISTGQPLVARVAFKPTSSIPRPLQTVTADGRDAEVTTRGRHDPCVALRGTPVVEAMAACALADAMLRHRAQVG